MSYTTNENIRLSFPGIEDFLLHTVCTVEAPAGATGTIWVASTTGIPSSGTVYAVDDANNEVALPYTSKTRDRLLFSPAITLANKIPIQTEIALGSAQLDYWRTSGAAWIDSQLTNPNFPASGKAMLEEAYVFWKATSTSQNEATRKWGMDVFDQAIKVIAQSKVSYPAALTQNICKLAEEGLDSDELDELRYGPDGDQ